MICLFQSNGAFTIQNETGLAELKQFMREISNKSQALNDSIQREKKKNVMFYAVIRGKTYNYNVDANVVFETVMVNEGGHYDRFHGVFVAPVSGTYLFSWTVSGTGSNYIVTELMVENSMISSAGEHN